MLVKMNTRHQADKPVKKCNYWSPIFEMECEEGQTASACQISWR